MAPLSGLGMTTGEGQKSSSLKRTQKRLRVCIWQTDYGPRPNNAGKFAVWHPLAVPELHLHDAQGGKVTAKCACEPCYLFTFAASLNPFGNRIVAGWHRTARESV